MKKILIPIVAVSALAAATVPAVASAQSINERQDRLERRIDIGLRNGSLTRTEAYRLRAEGEPLPEWHYLVCGDRDAVHRAGESIVGWTVSEDVAGPLENHLVERVV